MKVLFLKDTMPTAIAGEVVEVKDGFARNYLVPNEIAVLATESIMSQLAGLRERAEKRRQMFKADWVKIGESLADAEISFKVLSAPTGRLYGSVTQNMIAAEIEKLIERDFNRRGVKLEQPIRTTGVHRVKLNLYEGVEGSIKLRVLPEEGPPPAPVSDATDSTEADVEQQSADDTKTEEVQAEAKAEVEEPADSEDTPES